MEGRAIVGIGRGRGRGRSEVRAEPLATGRGRGRGVRVEKKELVESNAGEVAKADIIVPIKKEEEEEELHLGFGFLNPLKVRIPALSDSILPGDERRCLLYTMNYMNDPKRMYLHLGENFATEVDNFIVELGTWYEKTLSLKRFEMIVRKNHLRPGAVVVACHEEKGRKEWNRAKILESFETYEGICYTVLLLDLGDEVNVPPGKMYYLHRHFVEQPLFAVKAQLSLSSYYENDSYIGNYGWSYKFCRKLLATVFNERILVRFIRKGEQGWEVTLLSMKKPSAGISTGRPIEQQVVAAMTGSYVE